MDDIEKAVELCQINPNGTYTLYALIDGNWARFKWGNALMLQTDPDIRVVARLLEGAWQLGPKEKVELLKIPTTLVTAEASDEKL